MTENEYSPENNREGKTAKIAIAKGMLGKVTRGNRAIYVMSSSLLRVFFSFNSISVIHGSSLVTLSYFATAAVNASRSSEFNASSISYNFHSYYQQVSRI